jgi:hypothetical protein
MAMLHRTHRMAGVLRCSHFSSLARKSFPRIRGKQLETFAQLHPRGGIPICQFLNPGRRRSRFNFAPG